MRRSTFAVFTGNGVHAYREYALWRNTVAYSQPRRQDQSIMMPMRPRVPPVSSQKP